MLLVFVSRTRICLLLESFKKVFESREDNISQMPDVLDIADLGAVVLKTPCFSFLIGHMISRIFQGKCLVVVIMGHDDL